MSSETIAAEYHVFALDDGEEHWIVATSHRHACQVGMSTYSIGEEEGVTVTCEKIPADRPLTVTFDDGIEGALPEGATIRDNRVTASAEAWAKCCGNESYVGGTIW